MAEPLTEELLNELLSASSVDEYVSQHDVEERRFDAYLRELAEAHGMTRPEVVRAANINDTYGYELFVGRKVAPGRDKVLQLALAMHLSLRETDRLLQAAGASRLYCKDQRDAIIIFCLDRGLSLLETNEALYAHGKETLG